MVDGSGGKREEGREIERYRDREVEVGEERRKESLRYESDERKRKEKGEGMEIE